MPLIVVSFIAGVLTVLAPCALPLLPVIVGGSVSGGIDRLRPLVITAALGISIFVFTLLLKATAALIAVPSAVWEVLSGGIILFFGTMLLFPGIWEQLSGGNRITGASQQLVARGYGRHDRWGDILLGAALGPVFASCSPTYFVILGTVLPASFTMGVVYLLVYILGLSAMLLLIGYLGQKLITKLGWATDPSGVFRKVIGVLFIILGLAIMTGMEKRAEAWLIQHGFNSLAGVEEGLLEP